MTPLTLPFTLKVPGRDEFRDLGASSTSYTFRGMLRFDGEALSLEWTGKANVQSFGLLSVRDEHLELPTESIAVPVTRIQRARRLGGWWLPRLELVASDFDALSLVPSEEAGTLTLFVARPDRAALRAMAGALAAAIPRP